MYIYRQYVYINLYIYTQGDAPQSSRSWFMNPLNLVVSTKLWQGAGSFFRSSQCPQRCQTWDEMTPATS